MKRIYYTIEVGVMELRSGYPCYWALSTWKLKKS